MRTHKQQQTKRIAPRPKSRRGLAAVEAALLLPLIVFLLLGVMDFGQFSNCYQRVGEASREGSRIAARSNTTDVSDVTSAVRDQMVDSFPGLSSEDMDEALDVTLRDEDGAEITGSGLQFVESGDPIEVEVSFSFDSVRWFSGLGLLDNKSMQMKTVMRRE